MMSSAAQFVRRGETAFSIPARIAYAIEMSAGGELVNADAIKMRDDALHDSPLSRRLGSIILWVALIVGIGFGLLTTLPTLLTRRVQRVQRMLSQLT